MNKILIIEDSRTTAEYIEDILIKEMYSTNIATTGKQAFDFLEKIDFQIVLLDLELPDISGIEILKVIRLKKSQQQLPIIVLSATTDEQEIEKVLNLGANDFISKPFTPITFKIKVRNLLQLQIAHLELVRNNKQLEDIFNNIPIISLVVDNDVKVQNINRTGQEIVSKPNVLGLLGGEVFNCINALSENATCGKTEHCKNCIIRNSVNSTMEYGTNIYKKEGIFTIKKDEKYNDLTILVSTTPIIFKNKNSVLLSIDDITIEKQALNDVHKHLANEIEINKHLNAQTEELKQITENLNLLNDQLIESEHQYNLLFDNMTSAFFLGKVITDESGKPLDMTIVLINNKFEKLINQKRENVIGNTFFQIMPNANKETTLSYCNAGITGIPLNMEYYSKTFFKYFNANVYSPKKGYVAIILNDITERKQIENALKESEERFKLLAEIFPEIIFECDLQGTITYSNKNGFKKLGYTQQDLENGINIVNLIVPDDRARVMQQIQKRILNDIGGYTEYKPLRKDGSSFDAIAFSAPIFQNEKVVGVRGFILDITVRKKAEEELLKSEKRYKYLSKQFEAILDHIPGLIFYKDKKNNFITVNKYVAHAHKIEKNELEGKNCDQIYPKEDAENYWKDDLEVINSGIAKLNIEEPWDTGSERRWLNTSKIPFDDENGEIIGVLGLCFDITEKKSYEEKIIQQNEQLQELNATKDKLFSIIGHDLRGPIGGFKQIIELLLSNYDLSDTKRLTKLLQAIQTSASTTYDLLENLLSWAKSQRNEVVYNPSNINLNEISEISISLLEGIAKNKNITIKNLIPIDQFIYADENMIMTIVRNLISNAIKFTNENKTIYLSVIENEINLTISVKDEGIGIKQENLKKLFNSKENFTTYGTSGEKGTGLGLLLCKEFVEKHGGKIWIESEEGKGSDFKFTMPFVQ